MIGDDLIGRQFDAVMNAPLKFHAHLQLRAANPDIETPSFSDLNCARIFVFDETPIVDGSMSGGKVVAKRVVDDSREIALPFEVCWFEVRGRRSICMDDNQTFDTPADVVGLLVKELGPGKFKFTCFSWHETRRAFGGSEYSNVDDQGSEPFVKSIIAGLVKALQERTLGTERINIREKIRINREKKIIKIKSIIRVCSNHSVKVARPILGNKIDWSHRWEVMGHWRKISGIGKDRGGRYDIEGYTWVVPHTKGPDGKPVVKKIRVVASKQDINKGG